MASDVTCVRFEALAIFELDEPRISFLSGQVQASGPIVVPRRERSLTKLIADRLSLKSIVHGQKPQSMRGVPRRSTSPARPKDPISTNAMAK